MTRLLATCFAWSTLAIGIALAVPAQPLYEPEAPPKAPAVIVVNLNGTAWLGKYVSTNRTFIFEPDGTLSYKSATKTVFKNRGQWRLEGNTLHFEHWINPAIKLMEFRGTFKDANTIIGESVTKAGGKTTQTLQRTTVELK